MNIEEIEEIVAKTVREKREQYSEDDTVIIETEDIDDVLFQLLGMTDWMCMSDATSIDNDIAVMAAYRILRRLVDTIHEEL